MEDDLVLIAETIQSPDHTVLLARQMACGKITPAEYQRLRENIVHVTVGNQIAACLTGGLTKLIPGTLSKRDREGCNGAKTR